MSNTVNFINYSGASKNLPTTLCSQKRPHQNVPRKRSYIPFPERLAAALACLLPAEQRDDLRARKVPAEEVLALFNFDHIVLHAFDGEDRWSNLDPKLVAPHREKSRHDTAIVAKV